MMWMQPPEWSMFRSLRWVAVNDEVAGHGLEMS